MVHENAYFSVLQQDVEIDCGSRGDYFTTHFPRAAVGILARRATEILLILQYGLIGKEFVRAVPSSGVAEGERLKEAAAREFEEETGCTAGAPRRQLNSSHGCSDERFEISLASGDVPASGRFAESDVLGGLWFSREEVLELVRLNGIVDKLSLSPNLIALLEDRLRWSL